MLLINLLYLFIVLCILKIIINMSKWSQSKKYYTQYQKYGEGQYDFSSLKQNQHQVIKLFKDAGIKDSVCPVAEPVGMRHVSTSNISIFSNVFIVHNQYVKSIVIGMFEQAIGVYSSRIKETFNPVYWIETGIYLPKNMFSYLGVDSESVVIKIFQILYWTIGIIITGIYALYKNELDPIIKNIIEYIIL